MAHLTLSVITLLPLIISKATSVHEGYYWREYSGIIPSDAVIGGKDSNGGVSTICESRCTHDVTSSVAELQFTNCSRYYENMSSCCSSFITILIIINGVTSLQEDYYWREYTGTAPEDAVVGGKDLNGENIYIGQAYEKNFGLMPVQIHSDVKEVFIARGGKIKKVDKYTKILCGPQENFYWLLANYSTLHITLNDKHAVIGGHYDEYGYQNIGRITSQGEIKIGRIQSYNVGVAYLYYNDDGKESSGIAVYEILVYKNEPLIDPRINAV